MKDENSTLHVSPITLGRYKLLQRIGKGGMGEVWLAEDPRLHRQVAIKMLPFNKQDDREFLQRFEREAQAAAALSHPHILPIHDFGEQTLPSGQSITYIVMPYIAGGTLSDRVKMLAARGLLMTPEEAIKQLSQAAEAIDYAHGQQVLHRDIKPVNMLLRSDDWLLLADFGIARMLSASHQDHLTQAGVGIGTPEYMAPEQAQGKAEAASDNYSLAVIAYQLLTGQLPFHADTPYATTIQHMITPPPPPRQINPQLSEAIERALLHGLAKDPAQRPPSARAFITELYAAMTDENATPTYISQITPSDDAPTAISHSNMTPITPGQAFSPSMLPRSPDQGKLPTPRPTGITRRQLLIGGGSAAVLVAGGLGAFAIISRSNTPQTRTQPKATPIANVNAPVMTLLSHTGEISSLAWSPKATTLVSAGKDAQVMLWDIQAIQNKQASMNKPKALQSFTSTGSVLVAWSPDGQNIAIGNSGSVVEANGQLIDTIADVYTGDLNKRIPTYNSQLMTYNRTAYIQSLTWAPGNYLVTVSHPHEVTGTGEYVLEFRDPLQPQKGLISIHEHYFAYAVAASPDQTTVAIAGGLGITIGHPSGTGRSGQWNAQNFLLTFSAGSKQTELPTGGVTWSPNGQYVAAITNPQFISTSQIAVWDWQSQAQTPLSLPSTNTLLTTIAWSPAATSPLLAAGSNDGMVHIWSVDPRTTQGNTFPTRNLTGIGAQVKTLAWSADGQWLAAGYNDTNDSILIWKV